MEPLGIKDLLAIHNYLVTLGTQSPKMKECLEKIEDVIHYIIINQKTTKRND